MNVEFSIREGKNGYLLKQQVDYSLGPGEMLELRAEPPHEGALLVRNVDGRLVIFVDAILGQAR